MDWHDQGECAYKLVGAVSLEDLVNPEGQFNSMVFATRQVDELHSSLRRINHGCRINVDDAAALQPCLAYSPIKVIQKTIKNAMQCALTMVCLPVRMHCKLRFKWSLQN